MLASTPNPSPDGAPHADAVWIDLMDPSPEEARLVADLTGLHVPTRAELSEIESSSRLRRRGDVLYLSMPVSLPGQPVTPLGFVLSRERLLTVRFEHLPSVEAYAASCRGADGPPGDAMEAFLSLLEHMVDRLADVLEHEGETLERAAREIFHPDRRTARRATRIDQALRALLQQVGEAGEVGSRIRDSLLGVGRVTQYVMGSVAERITPVQHPRFETLRADIASLNDYQTYLAEKVQFLLDATLGFINIEQNNIIKVLTVVSIVGIPPTFVASLYGMNFHDIPELNWSFGYWYALALMVVTAVLPLVWFRAKGWL
jgi:magnesium transporter